MKRRAYRLLSLKQWERKSLDSLIRYITMQLRKKPKKVLARMAYDIEKSKLPRLRKRKTKQIGYVDEFGNPLRQPDLWKGFKEKRRKTKRKFSKKQLAAQRLFAKRARAGTLKRRRR